LRFFKKRGLSGSKNENKFSYLQLALKNTYETCARSPPTKYFIIIKIMTFFKKGGLWGSKNENFEKKNLI